MDEISQVIDIDGNVYKTVKIGSQLWLAENLKTTRYRNGDPLLTGLPGEGQWVNVNKGAFSNWLNQEKYWPIYGRLYNWYAIKDPRGLAPSDWHVPSDKEWKTLMDYLGGENFAWNKMKETGTEHWQDFYNKDSTNESGFSALPGGNRLNEGYRGLTMDAKFWSSAESGIACCSSGEHLRTTARENGLSVRCIKD